MEPWMWELLLALARHEETHDKGDHCAYSDKVIAGVPPAMWEAAKIVASMPAPRLRVTLKDTLTEQEVISFVTMFGLPIVHNFELPAVSSARDTVRYDITILHE